MIRHGLSFDEYERLPGWRWSHLKLLDRGSLLDVRHAQRNPEDGETAARRMLSAIHCAVLEPDAFDARYSVYDGIRRGKAYDAHCAEHADTDVLNPGEHDSVRGAVDAIMAYPDAARLLTGGHGEATLDWTDKATGMPCLARPDYLGPLGLVALKGAGVFEGAVVTTAARQGWHGQLAHYDAGARANGIKLPGWCWLVTYQVKPPHDVAVWKLDSPGPDGALFLGHQMRDRMMARAVKAMEREAAGEWIGRHRAPMELWLPEWCKDEVALTFGGNPAGASDEDDNDGIEEEVKEVWMSRPI